MHNFRKLNVYEKAIEAGCEVRSMLRSFPKEEMFALSQQFRRAVDSIALNIAEGAGNNSEKEFSRFLEYSIRSAYECICCLDIALKNSFIAQDVYDRLYSRIDEIIAMLIGLQRKIKG
ncbi:MAG: four helix bundle protein [Bacteroidetes bacterium]|nr:four helix bundle protein [Bacteroidota bacterium]